MWSAVWPRLSLKPLQRRKIPSALSRNSWRPEVKKVCCHNWSWIGNCQRSAEIGKTAPHCDKLPPWGNQCPYIHTQILGTSLQPDYFLHRCSDLLFLFIYTPIEFWCAATNWWLDTLYVNPAFEWIRFRIITWLAIMMSYEITLTEFNSTYQAWRMHHNPTAIIAFIRW